LKKILFVSLVYFIQVQVFAQHDFYIGAQTDLGVMNSPSFKNKLLDNKTISPHIGGLISLNYRLYDIISIEVGAGQNWNNTRLRDPSFEQENEGFSVKFNNKNYYWSYYAALSGILRIGFTKTYLYGKLGYSSNIYGGETLEKSKSFAITRLAIDKTVSSTTTYTQSNYSLIPEIGVQQKITNRNLISAGIKMNIGGENALQGVYTIKDNVSGTSITDEISSLGNFVALTLRYDLLLHHIPKKEKAKKKKKKVEEVPVVTTPKPTVTPPKVEDRKLIVTHKIKVHSPKVKVMIWDHQTVDGDRVSINLNGKWIIENYTLEKKKYVFEVELKEGVNTFVLHALNLGKYKPNTAAIIVQDGAKRQQIILESDLNESGTLEINYKKK